MATVKINEMLGLSVEEYEIKYIELYMRWCETFAAKTVNGIIITTDLQKLVANTSICKYFNERFADLEYQAYAVLAPQHGKITIPQATQIYNVVMVDIFSSYPKTLFDAARKLSIIPNSN